MVINTSTVLALRCSKCGKLNFHVISLFAFSGNHSVCVQCDCGAGTAVIGTHNYKKFSLQAECGMCETSHIYYFSLKELCNLEVIPLTCLETGLEVGYLGSKEKVREAVRNQDKSLIDLVEDASFADFFDNPDVMYQVLEYLNRISEAGFLTCRCGNSQIDLEILPDRLELGCSDCGARGVIFAETEEDFLTLKQLGKIELSEQGFVLRNAGKPKKSKRQSKK